MDDEEIETINANFSYFNDAIMRNLYPRIKCFYKPEYVNMCDELGYTSLHVACIAGNISVVTYLLNRGWNMESENVRKIRPIHYAIAYGNSVVVEELCNRGCSLSAATIDGYTALGLASRLNDSKIENILREALQRIQLTPSMEKYERIHLLGRGAYGHVYKCKDTRIDKLFALKEVMISPFKPLDNCKKSIENEIAIHKRLTRHPNIIQFYGTTKFEHSICIAMEYMELGSLRDKIDEHTLLSVTDTAWYTKQVLEGLKFLHRNNIIHRDIKSSNILLGFNEAVKLVDFGTCKYLETIYTLSQQRGEQGRIMGKTACGTGFYMAPEVMFGEDHDKSADVWSLGVTMVEMLTGGPPYKNLGELSAMMKVGITRRVEYDLPKYVPDELQFIIGSMFHSDPKMRPNVEFILSSTSIIRESERRIPPS